MLSQFQYLRRNRNAGELEEPYTYVTISELDGSILLDGVEIVRPAVKIPWFFT